MTDLSAQPGAGDQASTDGGWFVAQQGTPHGPTTLPILSQHAVAGLLRRDSLVWRAGMTHWARADSVPELTPVFATLPPDPPGGGSPPVQPGPIAGYAVGNSQDDLAMRMMLPVGRCPWAIAAGYLGLCSVLLVPAPPALACGIVAVIRIRKTPGLHGMGRAIFGIIMGGLGIAFGILALIGAAVG
ncbi:MAG: DUF4339 domain-containing protein [Phycisphaerales bacterium]|nr:DUF4339 domain-containing protein [Phycisphaerales bacterium]